MPKSSPNPMFDHLLESSCRDFGEGFGEEIKQLELIELYLCTLSGALISHTCDIICRNTAYGGTKSVIRDQLFSNVCNIFMVNLHREWQQGFLCRYS